MRRGGKGKGKEEWEGKGGEGLQPPYFNSWRRHCLLIWTPFHKSWIRPWLKAHLFLSHRGLQRLVGVCFSMPGISIVTYLTADVRVMAGVLVSLVNNECIDRRPQ